MNLSTFRKNTEKFIIAAMCMIAGGEKDSLTNKLMEHMTNNTLKCDHIFAEQSTQTMIRNTCAQILHQYLESTTEIDLTTIEGKRALFKIMMPIIGLPARDDLEVMFLEIFDE